jgi:hypothetical protein
MTVIDDAKIDVVLARSDVSREVLVSTLTLALEIAREGVEGRSVGALFTLGHATRLLERSRPLILDPLHGHSPAETLISDSRLRGTVTELARLDGAFVVSADGVVVAACRYLDNAGRRHPTAVRPRQPASCGCCGFHEKPLWSPLRCRKLARCAYSRRAISSSSSSPVAWALLLLRGAFHLVPWLSNRNAAFEDVAVVCRKLLICRRWNQRRQWSCSCW